MGRTAARRPPRPVPFTRSSPFRAYPERERSAAGRSGDGREFPARESDATTRAEARGVRSARQPRRSCPIRARVRPNGASGREPSRLGARHGDRSDELAPASVFRSPDPAHRPRRQPRPPRSRPQAARGASEPRSLLGGRPDRLADAGDEVGFRSPVGLAGSGRRAGPRNRAPGRRLDALGRRLVHRHSCARASDRGVAGRTPPAGAAGHPWARPDGHEDLERSAEDATSRVWPQTLRRPPARADRERFRVRRRLPAVEAIRPIEPLGGGLGAGVRAGPKGGGA